MKRKTWKRFAIWGILCALFTAASIWYTISYNGSRLLTPTDLSRYQFQPRDLPLLLATLSLVVYVLCLAVWCVRTALSSQHRSTQLSRRVSPKLGLLGALGFVGFTGFWTVRYDGTVFPFVFFLFFGFFGFFYEGKLSNVLMDERYLENRMRARATADRIALTAIFLSTLLLGSGRLMGNSALTLAAYIVTVSLSLALDLFLGEYLLYRYDHDDAEESET